MVYDKVWGSMNSYNISVTNIFLLYFDTKNTISKYSSTTKWAIARQNQHTDLCAQRRLRSARESAQGIFNMRFMGC